MPIARHTTKQLKRLKGRTRPKVLAATSEATIAGHGRADNATTAREELSRWHQVSPVDVVAIRVEMELS